MQQFLPSGSMMSIDSFARFSASKLRTLFFACILMSGFMMQAQAQSEPIVLKSWSQLPEAKFHFDSAYAVLKCDDSSDPIIALEAFNEGGNVTSIAFRITLKDVSGTSVEFDFQRFEIAPSKYLRYRCGDSETEFLSFKVPESLDPNSVFIEDFKYIK